MKLTQEQRDTIISRFISTWHKSERQYISIDADTFTQFFPFLDVVNQITDQSGRLILVMVDRKQAVEQTCLKYDLRLGKELNVKG